MDRAAGWTCASDPRFSHFAERPPLVEGTFEGAKLTIGVQRAGQLGLDDLRVLPPDAPLLEQKATQVAELELPEPAQIPSTAAEPAPLAQRRGRADRRLVYPPAYGFIALQVSRVYAWLRGRL